MLPVVDNDLNALGRLMVRTITRKVNVSTYSIPRREFYRRPVYRIGSGFWTLSTS